MPPPPVLVLRAVARSFHAGLAGCAASVAVLVDADLVVRAGERVAIVGAAGSGKTTLLLLAAGLLPADRGAVWRLPGGVLAGGPRTDGPPPARRTARRMPDRVVWRVGAGRGTLLVEVPAGHAPPAWASRVVRVARGVVSEVAAPVSDRRASGGGGTPR